MIVKETFRYIKIKSVSYHIFNLKYEFDLIKGIKWKLTIISSTI